MSKTPEEIVKQIMLKNDNFSKLLGMKVIQIGKGSSVVSLKVTKKMTNGFKIAHGGISYALADSAFAFACNSLGHIAVSVETSISHLEMVRSGEKLVAVAKMIHRSSKLGRFEVKVFNKREVLVADFKGTCFFTHRKH